MAKLFKTISLEDRWKASIYSQSPAKPSPVNQGSVNLKLTPEPGDKPSALLKQYLITKKADGIREPVPYKTDPISRYAVPFTNTKFRSSISLADRLAQTQLGSTTHLAQYFLADLYAGYITVNPFGIFNHTSDIVIPPFSFTPSQGGLNPTTITFDPATSQGMIFSNGIFTSFVNVQIPNYDTLLLQGAVFSNGIYTSTILPPLTSGPDSNIQDPGINPLVPIAVESMVLLQGAFLNNQNELVSGVDPTTPGIIPIQIPMSIGVAPTAVMPILVPSSIVLTTPTTNIQQGGLTPTPFVFEPNISSPVLDVLRYEAQRALAFFTPRIIHGSVDVPIITSLTPYKWTSSDAYVSRVLSALLYDGDQKDILLGAGLLNKGYSFFDEKIYKFANRFEEVQPDSDQEFATSAKRITPYYPGVEFIQRGNSVYKNPNSEITSKLGNSEVSDLSAFVEERLKTPAEPQSQLGKVGIDDLAGKLTPGNGSLSAYVALSYGQIKKRVTDKDNGSQLQDFRQGLQKKDANGKVITIPSSDYLDVKKTTSKNVTTPGDRTYNNDFIKFRVKSIRDDVTTHFRAFLTSFSDSYNVAWNDINYVGRQDTLKAFKGTTRTANVGFKMVAFSKQDLQFNYFKLNELVKSAAIGNTTKDSYFISGPLCQITIGHYFKNTPCIFTSIKYDVQTADYAWDLDEEVPQIIGVSLDFTILGDVNGTQLSANQNSFIGFKGK